MHISRGSVSTVIIKPTKMCNAACTYCSAPPEINDGPKWSVDDFKRVFDNLYESLAGRAIFIFHGGEPMLVGPDFYYKTYEYARSIMPEVRFAIQTNILGYNSSRWRDVFKNIMESQVSTSFDPDEKYRYYKGSTALYTRIFYDRLETMLDDGFRPMVIGTYTEETIALAHQMYDKSLSYGEQAFNLRFNYRYPAGRDSGMGEIISPKTYGESLISLYNRWIKDVPAFNITPLDQMFKKTILLETDRCPWTRSCAGHFFGVEPNGDVYNCADFADLQDEQWKFGNAFTQTGEELLKSKMAKLMRRRRVDLPQECFDCRHFAQCEGGCMRDTVLYGRELGGKFYYCESWKMVFDRIKESIKTGEADGIIEKMKIIPYYLNADQDNEVKRLEELKKLKEQVA